MLPKYSVQASTEKKLRSVAMEKCVPAEYTSSPIVDILASSVNDNHPRPPSWFDLGFTGHTSNANRERRSGRCADVICEQTCKKVNVREENIECKMVEKREVGLLERIVRSHPIWYLQHIGRPAATHLLRNMEEGVFIVRASSKRNAMALSIRLPVGYGLDTDHYLIESADSDKSVRLESSPNTFTSLPLLIEHYCLNG
ncbi:unnamed protein product [Enterobius vermicularis]|uniref:SH2 domain-containing protein n=1 Tax=Enterobius vermicularis TaxID=51028 RepID=A0A0N4VAA8_ENTVE|nr:unnamed protein product [Enterobius vermicularis]